MMPTGKASGNAVLAKARALYGSRLRADDYRRLMALSFMLNFIIGWIVCLCGLVWKDISAVWF